MHLQNQPSGYAGKLVLLGGTIENCSAGAKGGAVNVASGTLELSGDAVIAGNKKGTNVNNITRPFCRPKSF